MALTATLSEIRTGALERADMVNSSFRSSAQVTAYVNASMRKLYGLLVQARGADYYETTQTVTTAAGTATYALAAAFMAVTAVETTIDGVRVNLDRFEPSERQWLRDTTQWGVYGVSPLYRIVASNIEFAPIPTGVYSVTVRYIPAPTTLSSDGDTFDGICGWEEWIMWDVAAVLQMMQSRPVEASFSTSQRDMLGGLIRSLAPQRDASRPSRVRDVYL